MVYRGVSTVSLVAMHYHKKLMRVMKTFYRLQNTSCEALCPQMITTESCCVCDYALIGSISKKDFMGKLSQF